MKSFFAVKPFLKTTWSLLSDTVNDWKKNNAPRLAAALAFYSMFSIAPLLVIAISLAGLIFGREAATGQVVTELQNLMGKDAAIFVNKLINSSAQSQSSIVATVLGISFFFLGITGVTFELKDDLNIIWGVRPKPGIKGLIWSRFFSFGLVLALGFILLVSLLINSLLSGFGNYLLKTYPSYVWLLTIVNMVISYVLITLLFAAIYRVIPDVHIRWRDVLIGAVSTMALFSIGKFLIGLYLGNASFSSSYGAAGSLVIVLLWVNFSSQIVFLGAEFTKIYTLKSGSPIFPKKHAEFITENHSTSRIHPKKDT